MGKQRLSLKMLKQETLTVKLGISSVYGGGRQRKQYKRTY